MFEVSDKYPLYPRGDTDEYKGRIEIEGKTYDVYLYRDYVAVSWGNRSTQYSSMRVKDLRKQWERIKVLKEAFDFVINTDIIDKAKKSKNKKAVK